MKNREQKSSLLFKYNSLPIFLLVFIGGLAIFSASIAPADSIRGVAVVHAGADAREALANASAARQAALNIIIAKVEAEGGSYTESEFGTNRCYYSGAREGRKKVCPKTTVTFPGKVVGTYTLEGLKTKTSSNIIYDAGTNSPFIYFKNIPKNEVSVVIGSKLDMYFPKPLFNQKNGWILKPESDKISVPGGGKEGLFYELVVNEINLNRNGRNFSTKEEAVSFLENSDFFEKLGFSEVEKKNSLGYFIPKIQFTQNKNYYYLTVLDDSAIENISSLSINPKPANLVRRYFALYPVDVPVKTEGDFVFPKNVDSNNKSFYVKETGEILVSSPMLVFWNN